MRTIGIIAAAVLSTMLSACGSFEGPPGPQGERGSDGVPGPPGPQPGDATRSGERIKARFLMSDDGARTPAGWYDSELNLPCSFRLAGDGKLRCLPDVPKSDAFRVMYATSDCAGDAAAIGVEQDAIPCAPIGFYIEDVQHVACDAGTVVYTVGKKYTGDEPMFYSDGKGCFANVSYKFDFFVATVADPATTFVAGVVNIN